MLNHVISYSPLHNHRHRHPPSPIHSLAMDLKNYFTTVFIIFILLALPALSRGRLKLKTAKSNTEIYEIDYRGPETHSYMPPPNRSRGGNDNGDPLQNPKAHGESKRPTENARKKVKKVHG